MVTFTVTVIENMKERVVEKKNLLIEQYFDEVKPYSKDIIIDLQKCDTWKIQLTVTINFTYSKGTNKEWTIHQKRDNMESMAYDNLYGIF